MKTHPEIMTNFSVFTTFLLIQCTMINQLSNNQQLFNITILHYSFVNICHLATTEVYGYTCDGDSVHPLMVKRDAIVGRRGGQ